MSNRLPRSLLVTACCFLPVGLKAQTGTTPRPTPAQAQALLQSRPDLVAQLRQRFATSGLTKEQVHARLRAEGYPEDILDPYLAGATGDSVAVTDDVFRAVRALGVVSDSDVTNLQQLRGGTRPPQPRDTTTRVVRRDSTGMTIFGLDLFRSST